MSIAMRVCESSVLLSLVSLCFAFGDEPFQRENKSRVRDLSLLRRSRAIIQP
jgi:hypothetical protein